MRKHEQIAVFYKKQPTYNPIYTQGQPLHGKGKKYKTTDIKNQNYGKFEILEDYRKGATDKYPTSIISIQKVHPSKTIHPTQKPVELMQYLIERRKNKNYRNKIFKQICCEERNCRVCKFRYSCEYLSNKSM